ncbi:hypothetical protein VB738_05500 [Cyanobium gracile UHCC 0139]|uniref:Uncharacterized protein n=1 Tax=Cyanobium gracile UHCC 0139 TaxID=3110308 RepID=A0ABU5RSH8_9CYAN|nr:hypothetical protein [Cyanobium gracile]MEA5390715.1 hypothetical protein [Cyanobium gracile UHCC 0139]
MTRNDPEQHRPHQSVTDVLSLIALALFVTYGVSLLNAILPLAVGQPAWLSNLISSLLDGAPLALVGLGLVHLLADLEPDRLRLQARRRAVARWATVAVIGFLLLIPLQAISVVQGYGLVTRSQSSAMAVATERAEEFRRAIGAATSVEDLQQRIADLQGPGLQLSEGPQSLPELKRTLNQRLQESLRSSRSVIHSPWRPELWAIVQRTFRVLLLALVYALAFAAGSQRRDREESLLRELLARWHRLRARGLRRRLEARSSAPRALPADMAYFHALSVVSEPQGSGPLP